MLKNVFKLIIYFLGFVTVGAVAAFLVFELIDFNSTVSVPSLIGKSVSEATTLLDDRGLFLEVQGEEYDAKISPGKIVRQDITQGEKVKKGSSVKVTISKGKEMLTVPDFEGMDIDDVKLTLMASGIEIGKITRVHSDTVEKDRVIAQRPLPGYSGDNKVNLLVSLGPYEVSYRCPSFVNMTVDEARKIASKLGLELIEQDSGSVVIFQKPEPGAIVRKGDSVEVTLGLGGGFWF